MVLRLTCLASAVVAQSAAASAQTPAPSTSSPATPTSDPAGPGQKPGQKDVYLKAKVLTEDRDTQIWTAEGDLGCAA